MRRQRLVAALLWLSAAAAAVALLAVLRARSCATRAAAPAALLRGGSAAPAMLDGASANCSNNTCPTPALLTGLQQGAGSWPPLAEARLRCLSGVVTAVPGGRLANRVLEYASAWSLGRRHGLRLALPAGVLQPLRGLFRNLSAAPLKALLGRPPCRGSGLSELMVLRHSASDAQLYPVKRYVSWAARHSQPVVLRKWIVLTETIVEMSGRLREEFQYKEELARAAAETLSNVKREMALKAGPKYSKGSVPTAQVLAVGMHVRRTDYVAFLRYKYNATRGAGLGYYRRAAARMRKLLQPEGAALAFVVTSDDTRWCDRVLLPALRNDFKVGVPVTGAFLVSWGGVHAPDRDLALLSSVDHSVIAYGTYGTWGALMAGGRTIVFDMAAANPDMPPGMSTGAMHFARRLPSWEMLT
ncbi:galactoside alpha-(1,2)-fucosyltransferase 2-like [Schistocerca nitens]|uniref:galactoside alpha-(1,2)-fucosyltransferase 2-like n=1 Tax=Schistocerca nitens TaxID=7011 RepID=UPI0021183451|nr:galactoside alpha-(1,2)-fucosyltransferase 2-like [Schistocerca nitens]